MLKEPLVSVVIAAYNHENFIEECIHSILTQTYRNIELLVVDDGSRDQTWNALQRLRPECEQRCARVQFERQENRGTSYTMNLLLSMAHGKYLYDIASDDVAVSEAIEREAEFMETHPDYVLVVGNDDFIDEKSQPVAWDASQNPVVPGTIGSFSDMASFYYEYYYHRIHYKSDSFGKYETLVAGNYIPNGYMIRKAALTAGSCFSVHAPLEDWFLMLQLAKTGKMKFIDQILYHYRWHPGNSVKKRCAFQKMFDRTIQYEAKIVSEHANTELKNYFLQHANLHPIRNRIKQRLFLVIFLFLSMTSRVWIFFTSNFLSRKMKTIWGHFRTEVVLGALKQHGRECRVGRDVCFINPLMQSVGTGVEMGDACRLEVLAEGKIMIEDFVKIGRHCLIRSVGAVTIGTDSCLGQGVVLDASSGDIQIGRNTKIGPYAVISGPASIEQNSEIPAGKIVMSKNKEKTVCL